MIPFNKPYLTGKETHYIYQSVMTGKISGNGEFTKKCQSFFESRYGFRKCLLTTSCTDALEMAAMLCNIKPGDEVIIPSYTFVSTALAFVREGANIIFADSCSENPNIDAEKIEPLITKRTKAIVVVHYAGMACDMDKIMQFSQKYNLLIVEDAAQAIDSYYISSITKEKKPLGSIGHFGCFSFHETKNIISGEGGMLVINDEQYIKRAEIIWEKGTNRAEFYRGEINKYGWVDVGSSFLPSEVISAFLYAQLENLDAIQSKRISIWNQYYSNFKVLSNNKMCEIPSLSDFATNNGHMFYLICRSLEQRCRLIDFLKNNNILAVFHYLSLHKSTFYEDKHDGRELQNSDKLTDYLVRLPLFYDLKESEVNYISLKVKEFFEHE